MNQDGLCWACNQLEENVNWMNFSVDFEIDGALVLASLSWSQSGVYRVELRHLWSSVVCTCKIRQGQIWS